MTNISEKTRDSKAAALSLFDHVKQYGQNCAICAKPLKFTDTVYRDWIRVGTSFYTLRPFIRLLATCGCRPARMNGHDTPRPCENCGRSVSNPTIKRDSKAWFEHRQRVRDGRVRVFCSDRCRQRIKNALYHARHRANAPARKCDVCGTMFEGRADAKTCSPKCRKKRSRLVARQRASCISVTGKKRSPLITRQRASDVSVTQP